MEVGVYSANATKVLLEIYTSSTGANATYDYWMTKGTDSIWRAAIATVPNKTLYAFRAWGTELDILKLVDTRQLFRRFYLPIVMQAATVSIRTRF